MMVIAKLQEENHSLINRFKKLLYSLASSSIFSKKLLKILELAKKDVIVA